MAFKKNFIYLYFWLCWVFLTAIFSLVAAGRSYSFVAMQGLLIAMTSLVVEHRL